MYTRIIQHVPSLVEKIPRIHIQPQSNVLSPLCWTDDRTLDRDWHPNWREDWRLTDSHLSECSLEHGNEVWGAGDGWISGGENLYHGLHTLLHLTHQAHQTYSRGAKVQYIIPTTPKPICYTNTLAQVVHASTDSKVHMWGIPFRA